MYKSMAAFAAGLIIRKDHFIPIFVFGDHKPVWGISSTAMVCYSNLATAHKLSILGAMRAAQENLTTDARAYNALDKMVRNTANVLYGVTHLADLDHAQAVKVLLTVAK